MDSERKILLLVVEDDPAYLYLIVKAFSDRDANIVWELAIANDGDQALRTLFEEEKADTPLPDMILLDWNLPKISGMEVLQRLKRHEKLRRIPVLVFSSSASDEDIHAAYNYHANGYITKPGNVEALAEVVETIERFWIAIAQMSKVRRSEFLK
jgi:chemotaxis family two-component system response regulator Rcp1